MIRAALLAAAAILAWVVLRRWAQTPEPARPSFSYLHPHSAALGTVHIKEDGTGIWVIHDEPQTVTFPNQQTVTYTAGTH